MQIKSVEFAGAIGQIGQAAPETIAGLPQVAFSGRSNVGKSSLINYFLGRTRTPIARVSQTPGKTQEINFFHVQSDGGEFVVVDLPGYGYARVPQGMKEKWGAVIRSFLERRAELRGVVQLIDIRHGATPDDFQALEQLAQLELPVLLALTKSDKLKLQRRKASVSKIIDQLGVDSSQVIPCSALSGQGMEELREAVGALLGLAPEAG